MSKKSRRLRQPVISVFIGVLLVVAIYFIYHIAMEVVATFELKKQLLAVQEQLELIEAENQYLLEQKEKLLDPEYVRNYARAGFMLSKEGEQIFFLPED